VVDPSIFEGGGEDEEDEDDAGQEDSVGVGQF